MGLFGAAHGWGGKKAPLPKICHTYPTMMKLGNDYTLPTEDLKNILITLLMDGGVKRPPP